MPTIAEFVQCDSRNYTHGRRGTTVDYIVVHYTGTDASAHNNLAYFSTHDAQASAHYFIDRDGTLRQSVSESDIAWHAGKWAMNCRSIGIENVSAGEDFTEAQIDTLSALVRALMEKYGIGADHVIRHYDVTGKLCPAPYVDSSKWEALHSRITAGGTSAAKDEWVQAEDGRWWYRHADGSFTKSGWELVAGRWYLFDADGWMLTGWQRDNGSWYYLGADGAMLTGWQQVDGKWYYLADSGAMATGWRMVGDKWYYLDESGSMVQGWQKSGDKWYWLNADGSMSADEVKLIDGTFYGFDSSGAMLSHSLGVTEK